MQVLAWLELSLSTYSKLVKKLPNVTESILAVG
jgi:hypothetical protein